MTATKVHTLKHLKDLLNKHSDEELSSRIVITKGDELISTGHAITLVFNDDGPYIRIPEISNDPNFIK